MQTHPLTEAENERLRMTKGQMAVTATLRKADDSPIPEDAAEADLQAALEDNSLHFAFTLMGVHIGDAALFSEDDGARWDLRFDATALDRFAATSRHRDWKHGLIGSAMRGVWSAAERQNLAERLPAAAILLHPARFTAIRWDPSRDKEAERSKDLPLVNVTATGGGGSRLHKLPVKSKKR